MSDTPRQLGGRYELGELLGRGGMAEVHRGYDTRLGREVAIKLLRTDLARDPAFQARFRREAQSAAKLNHPSVVAIYDTGEDWVDGANHPLPYIVMEYVEGHTLRELLDSGHRLLPERALEIADGVLDALDYSHRRGIVHRDIKPANVMLTRSGQTKVMDFGIARALADSAATMTQTSAVVGTAQYLSPEQARGEQVDARSDIYSSGCLLYELLTGRPPFIGDSPVSVAYQHVREEPVPPSAFNPDVPAEADAIVLKALSKDKTVRYQTAAEMRADIQRALAGGPVSAPPAPAAPTERLVAVGALGALGGEPGAGQTAASILGLGGSESAAAGDGGAGGSAGGRGRRSRRTWAYVGIGIGVVAVFLLAAFFGSRLLGNQGGATVPVPKVVGLTEARAREVLAGEGFQVGGVNPRTDALPAGTVLEQLPLAGTRVNPQRTPVTLTVSSGPSTTTVPPLVGLTLTQAQTALAQAGLAVGRVDPRNSDRPEGEVLASSRREGEQVPVDSSVDLTVASGENTVPNVVGATGAAAQTTLQTAGFQVRTIQRYDTANPPGQVIDQTPPGNSTAPVGTAVTIVVATAPSATPTPSPSGTVTGPPPTGPPPTTPPATLAPAGHTRSGTSANGG